MKSSTERNRAYRERVKSEGGTRLTIDVDAKTVAALDVLTAKHGRSRKQIIEAAVQQAAINWECFDETESRAEGDW